MQWMPIIGEDLERLERKFAPSHGRRFHEGAVAKAPFYVDGDVVRLDDGHRSVFMVAVGAGELVSRSFYPLNGLVWDLIDANLAAGLSITKESALEYLRFYHDHLRGNTGNRFVIMESLDGFCLFDENLQRRPKPVDMRVVYLGSPTDEDFVCQAYVAHQSSLSRLIVRVRISGAIYLMKQEPQGFFIPVS